MSSKLKSRLPDSKEKGSDEGETEIPAWASHQIRAEDDPFHDDFEVELVPKVAAKK